MTEHFDISPLMWLKFHMCQECDAVHKTIRAVMRGVLGITCSFRCPHNFSVIHLPTQMHSQQNENSSISFIAFLLWHVFLNILCC